MPWASVLRQLLVGLATHEELLRDARNSAWCVGGAGWPASNDHKPRLLCAINGAARVLFRVPI
jgi:hypothetical protein